MTEYPDYIGIAKKLLEQQAEINQLKKQLDKLKAAISLLDSMVESGEQHTDQSRAAIKEALAALAK